MLPGATKTDFWGRFGVPHSKVEAILMSSEDCVDAALAGLDQHELITIPALSDASYLERYEEARLALYPFLSNKQSADRYKVGV